MSYTEEVLFTTWSNSWRKEMPTLLITYSNGKIDLHCQTGDHHVKAVTKATKLLKRRGLSVKRQNAMIASTGVYYQCVKPIHRLPPLVIKTCERNGCTNEIRQRAYGSGRKS